MAGARRSPCPRSPGVRVPPEPCGCRPRRASAPARPRAQPGRGPSPPRPLPGNPPAATATHRAPSPGHPRSAQPGGTPRGHGAGGGGQRPPAGGMRGEAETWHTRCTPHGRFMSPPWGPGSGHPPVSLPLCPSTLWVQTDLFNYFPFFFSFLFSSFFVFLQLNRGEPPDRSQPPVLSRPRPARDSPPKTGEGGPSCGRDRLSPPHPPPPQGCHRCPLGEGHQGPPRHLLPPQDDKINK